MDDKPLSRKELEHLQKVDYILDAAERVFAGKGYRGATVSDIAAEAEYSVGALYRFFKSKDELYWSVFRRKTEYVFRIMENAVESEKTPLDQMRRFTRDSFEFMAESVDFLKIYIMEDSFHELEVEDAITKQSLKSKQGLDRLVYEVYRRGVEMGQFIEASPVALQKIHHGIMHGIIFALIDENPPPAEELWSLVERFFFQPLTKRET